MALTPTTLNTTPAWTPVTLNTTPAWTGVTLPTTPSWTIPGSWNDVTATGNNWENETRTYNQIGNLGKDSH